MSKTKIFDIEIRRVRSVTDRMTIRVKSGNRNVAIKKATKAAHDGFYPRQGTIQVKTTYGVSRVDNVSLDVLTRFKKAIHGVTCYMYPAGPYGATNSVCRQNLYEKLWALLSGKLKKIPKRAPGWRLNKGPGSETYAKKLADAFRYVKLVVDGMDEHEKERVRTWLKMYGYDFISRR